MENPENDTAAAPHEKDRRTFLVMNAVAGGFMVVAAAIVFLMDDLDMLWLFAAAVLVLVGITVAVASYPFYRRFMRAEVAARRKRPRR